MANLPLAASRIGFTAGVIALSGASSVGRAQPTPRAHLIYAREAGAERCPDEEAVRLAVAARLGYDPFSPQAKRTVTVGVRGAGGGGLVASIELSDATGEVSGRRQLTSPRRHCADVAPALEFAIALAIDPLGAMQADSAPPPAPAGDPPDQLPASTGDGHTGSNTAPATPPPAPRRPPPPPQEPTRIRGGLGVLLAIGAEPAVTAGFTAQVGFRQRAWSINIELRGDLPVSRAADGGSVTTALALAALVPCLHVPLARGRIDVAGCVLVVGGAQWAEGQFPRSNPSQVSAIVLLGARAALEVPFGRRLALLAHADFLGTVLQPPIALDNGTPNPTVVFTPSVSGAIGAALLVYFR